MTEFELKLEVPPSSVKGLAAFLRQGGAVNQRLIAGYFDTEDGALAADRIVVRMRKEGAGWVQTAKGPGQSLVHRMEHNVPVHAASPRAMPPVDLSRHDSSPIGNAIHKALGMKAGEGFPSLLPLYRWSTPQPALRTLPLAEWQHRPPRSACPDARTPT